MYYNDNTIVFHNGNWIAAKDAKTSLFDQTLHYGTGVLEGIRSYRSEGSYKVFRALDHFKRLHKSAEMMHLALPYSPEELTHIAYDLLEKNHLTDAYIRPLVYAGQDMMLRPTKDSNIFMAAWKWKKYNGIKPLDVMVSQYRKPSAQAIPIEAKVVGNYSSATLVSAQARNLGYDEALLLDANDHVAEGPASNFFYEKDNVLYTPKLGNILPGITRAAIFHMAKELGVTIIEKDIVVEELYEADQAFFCGTASEISQIQSINGEKMKGVWEDSASYSLHFIYQQKVRFDEFEDLTIV